MLGAGDVAGARNKGEEMTEFTQTAFSVGKMQRKEEGPRASCVHACRVFVPCLGQLANLRVQRRLRGKSSAAGRRRGKQIWRNFVTQEEEAAARRPLFACVAHLIYLLGA